MNKTEKTAELIHGKNEPHVDIPEEIEAEGVKYKVTSIGQIYMGRCGEAGFKGLKKVGADKTSFTVKGLKKKSMYKFYMIAQTKQGDSYKTITKSKVFHFVTGNVSGKYTNAKTFKLKKKSLTIQLGKKAKIQAQIVKEKSGKELLDHGPKLRYTSTDPGVAEVDAKGRVTGKRPGSCKIFVQTSNVIWKTVKVKVK